MNAPRILAIDDEQHILDVIVYVLEQNGFVVSTAADGDAGLRRVQETSPDLVLLDLNLPGIAGLDLFHRIRELRPGLPVIMLTARSEEIDRVVGLEVGADDYVTKPFSPRELAARVRAVLRRSARPAPGPAGDQRLTAGPLAVDPEAQTATAAGRPLDLTRAEFKLLESLLRHPARVFSRDALMTALYDDGHVVSDRSIDACVKRLRRKCEEARAGLDPVETVHGVGYKLNPRLERDA